MVGECSNYPGQGSLIEKKNRHNLCRFLREKRIHVTNKERNFPLPLHFQPPFPIFPQRRKKNQLFERIIIYSIQSLFFPPFPPPPKRKLIREKKKKPTKKKHHHHPRILKIHPPPTQGREWKGFLYLRGKRKEKRKVIKKTTIPPNYPLSCRRRRLLRRWRCWIPSSWPPFRSRCSLGRLCSS